MNLQCCFCNDIVVRIITELKFKVKWKRLVLQYHLFLEQFAFFIYLRTTIYNFHHNFNEMVSFRSLNFRHGPYEPHVMDGKRHDFPHGLSGQAMTVSVVWAKSGAQNPNPNSIPSQIICRFQSLGPSTM